MVCLRLYAHLVAPERGVDKLDGDARRVDLVELAGCQQGYQHGGGHDRHPDT